MLLIAATAMAQKPQQKSFPDIFQDMERQMQRGIPQQMDTIRLKPGQNEYFQYGPDSSSYFYFKVDTTFGGHSMQQFFKLGDSFGDPFGGSGMDPFGGSGFGNFEDMFRQMEEMQRQLLGLPPVTPAVPQEDDGLLPEERIRQREENPTGDAPKPHPKPATPVKPKIKTTRI